MSSTSTKKRLARITRRFRDWNYQPAENTARRIAEPLSITGRSEMAAFRSAWDQHMPQFLAATSRARAMELELENLRARVAVLEAALARPKELKVSMKSSATKKKVIE